MDNEIFEVSYEEYMGFLNQIKKDAYFTTLTEYEELKVLEVYSKKTNKLLARQTVNPDEEKKFYVIEMPDDDERKEAPHVRQIRLETEEEVKQFFEALMKAVKKDD